MTDETAGDQHAGMDVSALRRSATDRTLEREDLNDDPFLQFEDWFQGACALDRNDPNAMGITTLRTHGAAQVL